MQVGVSNALWVRLLAGGLVLGTTSCAGLTVGLVAVTAAGQRTPGRAQLAKQNARAEELRAALDGDAKITATDKSCEKATCETVSTEHYDGITRTVAKGNPDAKGIVVLHMDIDHVAAPADYVASCARTWIVTRGPLKKLAVIEDAAGLHFVTAAFLLPSTGHGLSAAQTACVEGLIR